LLACINLTIARVNAAAVLEGGMEKAFAAMLYEMHTF
jgi:hypothetical protein